MALRLIIQDEEGATTIVPLGDEEITIGREAGNTIQLTEQNVSRQHARLTLGPDGWVLEDLDSYNGIKVNGVSVEGQITLNEGDLVQIGDYHLSLAENVEKTTLNLDRPAVAANSQEVGELPAAVLGEAAATGAIGGAASLSSPLTPPQPTYAEPAEEAEPKGRGGLFALLGVLLIAVGVGGYFALGGGDEVPKKPAPVTQAPADAPETPPPEITPPATPPETPPADPTVAEAVDSEGADPDDGATATDGDTPPPIETTPTKEPATKKKPPTTTKKPPVDKPAAPQGDPKELLDRARKASVDGNSAQAYKLAKESYAIEKSAEALKMMGVSACKMGDAAKAQAAYNKVDASTKKALTIVCGQKGVELVDK